MLLGERLVKWILHAELLLNLNRSQGFSSDAEGIFFIVMKIHLSSLSLYFESMINFEHSLLKVRLQYSVCVWRLGVGGSSFFFADVTLCVAEAADPKHREALLP